MQQSAKWNTEEVKQTKTKQTQTVEIKQDLKFTVTEKDTRKLEKNNSVNNTRQTPEIKPNS